MSADAREPSAEQQPERETVAASSGGFLVVFRYAFTPAEEMR